MTPQQAAQRWQQRQAQTLQQTYVQAWQTGVRNFQSQYATPPTATPLAAAPPTQPNPTAMSRALAPALLSLARMGAQIVVLTAGLALAAAAEAIGEYLEATAWLLAAGVSVAWAGEQAGYAQAAHADRLLLAWELDPGPVHHCSDCPALAALPPMPLDQWPTLPGEGATECSVGCKCSMRGVPGPSRPLTHEEQALVSRVGARQPVLVAA